MSATFSRILVNPAIRAARHALASPQRMHAIVMRSFGPDNPGRTLWRLDPGTAQHTLFVVGQNTPNPEILATELGAQPNEVISYHYGRFLDRLESDQEWRFRLRANPTRAVRHNEGRSSRIAIGSEPQQLEWLKRQGKRSGFTLPENRLRVPEVVIRARGTDEFRRHQGEAPVTLGTVLFDGILRISSPDTLRSTLVAGLGRGKAYGNGLLTLAPLSSSSE